MLYDKKMNSLKDQLREEESAEVTKVEVKSKTKSKKKDEK